MTDATPSLPLYRQTWPEDTRPVVSVFCFAFNHGRMIIDCLDAVLRQVTDFRVEILVHDDASTDGTAAILKKYQRRFPHLIRLVLQTENQWSQLKRARPVLTTIAQGEFIASCDGDDVWLDPEKLAKQVRFLRANPDYMLSFHNAFRGEDPRRKMGALEFQRAQQRDYTRDELHAGEAGWMLMGSVVYRHVIQSFPPEYALIPNGDNFLPILFGEYGHAKYQRDVTPFFYRQHPQSMWSSRSPLVQTRMHAQSWLQICAYLIRTGHPRVAKKLSASMLQRYLDQHFAQADT